MTVERKTPRVMPTQDVIENFSYWQAHGEQAGDEIRLADYGDPKVRYGCTRAYCLLVHDISPGGARLTLVSELLRDRSMASLGGHRLLTRIALRDPAGESEKRVAILALADVRYVHSEANRVEIGLEFLAHAACRERQPCLLQVTRPEGVPQLVAWCHSYTLAHEDVPQEVEERG